jgi:hypothetical protein
MLIVPKAKPARAIATKTLSLPSFKYVGFSAPKLIKIEVDSKELLVIIKVK